MPVHTFGPIRQRWPSSPVLARRNVGPMRTPSPRAQALLLPLVPLVVLGLGRFAYGALLPAMRTDLGWGYRDAAVPAIGNGAGYLIGALTASWYTARVGSRTAAASMTAVTAVVLAATGAFPSLMWITGCRLVSGATGAWAYVAGGVLATDLRQRGVLGALTWFPAGGGAGVVLSVGAGLWLEHHPASWPLAWVVFGVAGVLAAWIIARTARGTSAIYVAQVPHLGGFRLAPAAVMAGYCLFGAGYIGYSTFVLSYLAQHDVAAVWRHVFWATVGVATMVAAPLWHRFIERLPRGWPLGVPMAGCTASTVLVLASQHPAAIALAAVTLGGCWLNTTAGVAVVVRRGVGPAEWGRAFAALTAAFGVGQMVGPIATFGIGDGQVGVAPVLGVSAVVLGTGAAVAGFAGRD